MCFTYAVAVANWAWGWRRELVARGRSPIHPTLGIAEIVHFRNLS